jgi:hypothetical protein
LETKKEFKENINFNARPEMDQRYKNRIEEASRDVITPGFS